MTTINIKGDIVDNDTASFYSWFGMDAVSPSGVEKALKDASDNSVTVNIASGGGDVFAASEIYTMLRGFDGEVTVNIQGLAASAASVIAMAGDTVNMAPTAQMMIHKAWSVSQGNSDDHDHESKVLESIDDSIINAYAAKTKLDRADIAKMMSDETWMTAQEAVDKGFADNVMFAEEKQPQFANAVGHTIPSHAKVAKFMKMLTEFNGSEKPTPVKPKENKTENPAPSVKTQKLDFLYGKKE